MALNYWLFSWIVFAWRMFFFLLLEGMEDFGLGLLALLLSALWVSYDLSMAQSPFMPMRNL